ncbi:MAG: MFS transporter [Bacteroidales bacterium]|nr:MFS transporter [Bacteroidales bacterium]MCF8455921.1 MFS transporter [Bacteroidales bacterium]
MQEQATRSSHVALFLNTLAFTVCFACWMLNGVLVTFLVDNQVYNWSPVQIGWLMGLPVLTGALFRLPAGVLTDRFGGKPVYSLLLVLCAVPMFLLSKVDSFLGFALCSFGFGFTGVSFAIGIAFTSVWYPKKWQGTALGIFGAGNAGAAITTLLAPTILKNLTNSGADIDAWRTLPVIYAVALLVMGVIFFLFSTNKKPATRAKTVSGMLKPLKDIRVWRFGLYYFLVFGCFVAFSQWLVPYFVNVYMMPLVTAGIFAAAFSLPSGLIRALGGWMSDKLSARSVMYWVLGISTVACLMLVVPKMQITSPGKGIMAKGPGTVTEVTPTYIMVGTSKYEVKEHINGLGDVEDKIMIWPRKEVWQEPIVELGESVSKKQLIAKGVSRIYFQATMWVFAVLVILIGSVWGIGKAAVYKFIPDYFPEEVGVVGGMVGVLGGLGGFFCPIVFGYLLEYTGLWTSCWMFMFGLSLICLVWLYRVSQQALKAEAPQTAREFERHVQPE